MEAVDNDGDFDAATINLTKDVKYNLAGDDGDNDYGAGIYGTLSWSTIKDHEGDTNYEMKFQGRSSGKVSSYIDKTYSNEYFTLADTSKGGDSGAPMYHVSFDGSTPQVYIGGVLEGNVDYQDDGSWDATGGTYIGKVENKFNLSV
jgi:hypothetical protein